MQLHPKHLQAISLRKCSAGFNHRESKWASRRRGEQKKLALLHLWFIGKKKISNLIFLPAHKCSGLFIVTQNPPIADKAVQMLVAYFLMAEFSSLACFDMCSSTSRRGIHKIEELRTHASKNGFWDQGGPSGKPCVSWLCSRLEFRPEKDLEADPESFWKKEKGLQNQ